MSYSVYVDDELLYATGTLADGDHVVLAPNLTQEINTAGSFTCIVPKTNKEYNNIKLRLSTISIYHDEEIEWRGRPTKVSIGFNGSMEITCEGSLAFLNDTVYPPDTNKMRLGKFVQKVLANHNEKCDYNRQINIGLFTMDDIEIEYSGSDTVTMEVFKHLMDTYGGYIIPHETDGGSYFDWVKTLAVDAENTIDMTDLIDISKDIDADDVYTVIIPTGKDGMRLGCEYIENEIATSLFGKSWTTVSFNDIEDEDELYTAAANWLNENIWSSLQLDITASDAGSVFKIGTCYLASIQKFGVDREVALVGYSSALDDDASPRYTFSASTIFTQINDGRDVAEVYDVSKKIKTASQNSLTAKTAKTESYIKKSTYYSGKIEFSDGTFLNVTNGLITGGKSSEGEF